MSSNRQIKEELIKRYGAKCFIERLHLRDTSGLIYKGKGQYEKMKALTYHHIQERSKGGQTTIENGALLSNENHIWFNEQTKGEQQVMNRMFQQLKRDIDECRVSIVDDLETSFEVKGAEIKFNERGEVVKEEPIQVGDYIRTRQQGIRKIAVVSGDRYGYQLNGEMYKGTYFYLKREDIVAHSKDITDIIRVGDFVNGEEIIQIRKPWLETYPNTIHEMNIKTVVTREQLKEIEFRMNQVEKEEREDR